MLNSMSTSVLIRYFGIFGVTLKICKILESLAWVLFYLSQPATGKQRRRNGFCLFYRFQILRNSHCQHGIIIHGDTISSESSILWNDFPWQNHQSSMPFHLCPASPHLNLLVLETELLGCAQNLTSLLQFPIPIPLA